MELPHRAVGDIGGSAGKCLIKSKKDYIRFLASVKCSYPEKAGIPRPAPGL